MYKVIKKLNASYLWGKKTDECDTGAERDGDGHAGDAQRHVGRGAEVQWYERQPYDTRRVHREAWIT